MQIPTSFARESFFAVSAFKFTNADCKSRYGRYRILPVAGAEYLDEAAAGTCGKDFLLDEIKARTQKESVKFRIVVQLAEDGDITDDATVRWPEDRPLLAFGDISLIEIAPNRPCRHRAIQAGGAPARHRRSGLLRSAQPFLLRSLPGLDYLRRVPIMTRRALAITPWSTLSTRRR